MLLQLSPNDVLHAVGGEEKLSSFGLATTKGSTDCLMVLVFKCTSSAVAAEALHSLNSTMKASNAKQVKVEDDGGRSKMSFTENLMDMFNKRKGGTSAFWVKRPKFEGVDGSSKEAKDYRLLWRQLIRKQIQRQRLERFHIIGQAADALLAERKEKLDYNPLVKVKESSVKLILSANSTVSRHQLTSAVLDGVDAEQRGELWQFLANYSSSTKHSACQSLSYSSLKSQLAPNQHSILLDLGRTFPAHAFFKGALGPGQLSLFNLLKAYSLLDHEVGYCQGLPFLAGLLLMHLEEEQAFSLFCHLLMREKLRTIFHPEMGGLHSALHQLDRLLRARPKLHNHLEVLQVDVSLYATPWIVTIFAASFPLGFVVRVLDLVFLQGKGVLVNVAISLLDKIEDSLLAAESLEQAMAIFKTQLPDMEPAALEEVIQDASCLYNRSPAVGEGVTGEEGPKYQNNS